MMLPVGGKSHGGQAKGVRAHTFFRIQVFGWLWRNSRSTVPASINFWKLWRTRSPLMISLVNDICHLDLFVIFTTGSWMLDTLHLQSGLNCVYRLSPLDGKNRLMLIGSATTITRVHYTYRYIWGVVLCNSDSIMMTMVR